jgi:hypothetical protein
MPKPMAIGTPGITPPSIPIFWSTASTVFHAAISALYWRLKMYQATEHSTVKEKEKFATQFKKFVESGYKRTKFPQWFYRRLSLMFGHIAHYDCQGFFAYWFSAEHDTRRWENRVMYWKAYGDPKHTWSDVEIDLSRWLASLRGVEVADNERMIVLG